MKDDEVELAIMAALWSCGATEECDGCPLYAEANDESCARYVMAMARNPEGFETKAGRVVPKGGADALREVGGGRMAVTADQVRRVAEARKELNAALAEMTGNEASAAFVYLADAGKVREAAEAAGVPVCEKESLGLVIVSADAFGVEFLGSENL